MSDSNGNGIFAVTFAALAALYASVAAYLGLLLYITRARTLVIGTTLFTIGAVLALLGWYHCS